MWYDDDDDENSDRNYGINRDKRSDEKMIVTTTKSDQQ